MAARVNIFSDIMRRDVIAEGVIAAAKKVGLKVPLMVRLGGTNAELGKDIIRNSGLPHSRTTIPGAITLLHASDPS